jgi:hypothetical protein
MTKNTQEGGGQTFAIWTSEKKHCAKTPAFEKKPCAKTPAFEN